MRARLRGVVTLFLLAPSLPVLALALLRAYGTLPRRSEIRGTCRVVEYGSSGWRDRIRQSVDEGDRERADGNANASVRML